MYKSIFCVNYMIPLKVPEHIWIPYDTKQNAILNRTRQISAHAKVIKTFSSEQYTF